MNTFVINNVADDLAPVPLNIELTKFDRIQILLEIHIAVLSRIVGLS